MKVKIAHISDSHFGTEQAHVIQALKESLKNLKPDLVLFTGDITQRARRSQFVKAREFIEGLRPAPVFTVPGNHDIPLFHLCARIFYPYRYFKKYISRAIERELVVGDVQLFALNSTSWKRHIQGELDAKRVQALIQKRYDHIRMRIVCLHHPVTCAKEIDLKNLLKNKEQIAELFSREQIDLVLGGHVHDPHVELTAQGYVAVVAGTCTSYRTRKGAPNSFNWIECEYGERDVELSIRRMDINSQDQFVSVREARFRRSSEGWQAN